MTEAIILLGGNTGNVRLSFKQALDQISAEDDLVAVSSLYSSPPWGFDADQDFLNMAAVVRTKKTPHEFLSRLLKIESALGRIRRGGGYASRIIDIDIMFWDQLVIRADDLEIPHPRLHLRRFALVPLAELVPGMVHPVFNKPVSLLLAECQDESPVMKLEDE